MSPFISRPGYHISQGTRVSAKSHEDFRFSYLFVNSVKILLSLAYPSPLFYLSHCLVFFSPVVSTVVEERRCLIHSNAVRVPLYRSLNTVARDNVSENFRTVRPTNCFFPFCFCFLYRSPFFFEESDRVSFDRSLPRPRGHAAVKFKPKRRDYATDYLALDYFATRQGGPQTWLLFGGASSFMRMTPRGRVMDRCSSGLLLTLGLIEMFSSGYG